MKHLRGSIRGNLLLALVSLAPGLGGCSGDDTAAAAVAAVAPSTTTSSTLALTADDSTLWVVNQDSDSVSVIDTKSRALVAEIPLADGPPAADPVTKRYEPRVTPRALALFHDGEKVYVAGQTANQVLVIDGASRTVKGAIDVPAEPTGVACAPDGSAVYVVSQQGAEVLRVDPSTDEIVARVSVTEKPWNVTVSEDGAWLYVPHLLQGAGVTIIDAATMTVRNKVALADQPVASPFDKHLPSGPARGLYGAALRPGTGEIWVPHMLLAIGTAQTDPVSTPETNLDFESTVFPTISTIAPDGAAEGRRLLFKPLAVAGAQGSFTDIVSGPRAVAFTPDGKLALVAMGQSEDVMVFDAETGTEKKLVRPLPSAMLEGIVVNHAGTAAYVDGRNTHDVTVLAIDEANDAEPVRVDGASIDRIGADPMPEALRLGQRLFYTANSAAYPITKNFWVACSSCHVEGGSDAVTWIFKQGPRDTPSNAGGMLGAGFMFRQATRNRVQQYDETIRVEQGGNYDENEPAQKLELDALADFVNYAIPFPENPYLAKDGTLTGAQARGKVTFDAACAACHGGPLFTDSGADNPDLDLAGTVTLHDVGTCDTKGDVRDRKAEDREGHPREACEFDTPTLRGVFATAPYLHDGSAATLREVVDRLPFSSGLSSAEKDDLVEYLRAL